MAGTASDNKTYLNVYVYDINGNKWYKLPGPGQFMGRLVVINGELTVIGGMDVTTGKITNKVTTYNNRRWNNFYPNMIKARLKPGVGTYFDYVIVAGGILPDKTNCDRIEVLDYKQSSHWIIAGIKLPQPMWSPSLTISDNHLYIVGYNRYTKGIKAAYKHSIDTIIISTDQLTRAYWSNLPLAPYYCTTIMSNSSLPMLIGGSDIWGVTTADIRVLDVSNNSWQKIASLTSPRAFTAVVPINLDSILVIGGCTGGRGLKEAKKNSITKVEKGTIRICYTQ